MQGSIYIYAMDGTPLFTGKSAQAMAINSKIGIVTGLTLDPIKKVTKFDLNECRVECCEKYKSFKLKIPQPDSELRHSPDFRTVFGVMIGPFSFCEIGKT